MNNLQISYILPQNLNFQKQNSKNSRLLSFQILCTMIVLAVILNKEKAILGTVILVLGTGFMSRIAMGFSPTVWVSGIRTFFMLYLALAFTLSILSVKVFQKNKFALLFSVPFVVYGIIMNII